MKTIEILQDGIKISYPILFSFFLIIVLSKLFKTVDKNLILNTGTCQFGNHSDYKMVICVRQDLGMGKGKIAAQCGHAILGAYKRAIKTCPNAVEMWEKSGQAKIVLKVVLDELFESDKKAKKKGVPSYLVRDAGRTQISPGEYTAIAIGPAPSEILNEITGEYKLLKNVLVYPLKLIIRQKMKYINIMPFKIRFDGEMTNIKNGNSHFLRYVKNLDKSNSRLSAIFRGRRLSGEKIDLKSRGLSMLVASSNPISVGSKIDINDEVSNLIYWNYDEEVRPSDDIPQVVNIAQFINIIHSET